MELVKSELAFKDEETIKAHEEKVKDHLVKMMLEIHRPLARTPSFASMPTYSTYLDVTTSRWN